MEKLPCNRRDLFKTGLVVAGGLVLPAACTGPGKAYGAESGLSKKQENEVKGRRKLGKLEVSSIGLGVQNMSRTYQTTIPSRSEM